MAKGIWMDEKKIRRMEQDTWKKCIILSTAYLMDEFDYRDDKIEEYLNGLDRYMDALEDHLITMDQVCDIIFERTGVDFSGKGDKSKK